MNKIEAILQELKKQNLSNSEIEELSQCIKKINEEELNILFVGATGVGKSSTINAIFDADVAKVGYSPNPETMSIKKYEMDNMVLWDTPGLGDSPDKDRQYAKEIINALKQTDSNGNLLIDEVVVLVDGSNRDMKTTYEIIEKIILPYMEEERIVIAINQCDMAMKGRHWNEENACPEPELEQFLNSKVESIEQRILASTGVQTNPIFYSALYKYNISKLLCSMIKNVPDTKRFLVMDNLNEDPEIWAQNDDLEDYNAEIQNDIKNSMLQVIADTLEGARAGARLGAKIPVIGKVVGAVVGGALGFLGSLIK